MGMHGTEGRLIHVGIASYRDPLCPKTLYNMFTKAKHPEKLRVRVIQQNGEYAAYSLKTNFSERMKFMLDMPGISPLSMFFFSI